MAGPALALLELLEQDYFDNTLCIDADRNIKKAIDLRSGQVYFVQSKEHIGRVDFPQETFDLIVSYSDSKPIIQKIYEIKRSKKCEILIISNNLITYNPKGTRKPFFARKKRYRFLKDLEKIYYNFSVELYYPFPNIFLPEMILSKSGVQKLYFRYWSWKGGFKQFCSKLCESIMVQVFKSPMFSPHIVVKLSKDET